MRTISYNSQSLFFVDSRYLPAESEADRPDSLDAEKEMLAEGEDWLSNKQKPLRRISTVDEGERFH